MPNVALLCEKVELYGTERESERKKGGERKKRRKRRKERGREGEGKYLFFLFLSSWVSFYILLAMKCVYAIKCDAVRC